MAKNTRHKKQEIQLTTKKYKNSKYVPNTRSGKMYKNVELYTPSFLNVFPQKDKKEPIW